MKQEWIEDFLALVESGTFSRAAVHRNVTQPAFSRRIQLLERWLGVELIDRHRQPVQLTAVAQRYVPVFRTLLHDMMQLRTRIQAEQSGSVRLVFTTQHSLTMTRLPALLRQLGSAPDLNVDFSVRSENRDECVALFMRGQADLLLCIEEAHDPLLNLMPKVGRLQLGTEVFVPVTAPAPDGLPLHGHVDHDRVKVLAFPSDSYLGRVMEVPMSRLRATHTVEVIHESVFLAGVMEMVKAGLGMAWLPVNLAEPDIRAGSLIDLSSTMSTVTMQLSLYRHVRSPHADVIQKIYKLLESH